MYDAFFYKVSRPGMMLSAQTLVPMLMNKIEWPRTVIDVGCGEGWWALEFAKQDGTDVVGIDGDWHGEHLLGDRFITHNLSTKLPNELHGRFDTVVCLEVAEHLQAQRAASFVADLCKLVRGNGYVVFSAAIPHQGGTGHVNEQWPAYWAELFNRNGFSVNSDFRFTIWNDDRIENWYRQNLLIAYPALGVVDKTPPLPVVHPVLWKARQENE